MGCYINHLSISTVVVCSIHTWRTLLLQKCRIKPKLLWRLTLNFSLLPSECPKWWHQHWQVLMWQFPSVSRLWICQCQCLVSLAEAISPVWRNWLVCVVSCTTARNSFVLALVFREILSSYIPVMSLLGIVQHFFKKLSTFLPCIVWSGILLLLG